MNLYHAILQAAEMRRRCRDIENTVGRAKRRESFLASVPRDAGDTTDIPVRDLADFRDDT